MMLRAASVWVSGGGLVLGDVMECGVMVWWYLCGVLSVVFGAMYGCCGGV